MLIKTERELERYKVFTVQDALANLTLSSTSPSGIRYCVDVMGEITPSVPAGTPTHTQWPPSVSSTGHCLYPMDYSVHIQTGWDIQEIAVGMWDVQPTLQDVPAAVVREALEIQREIQLLAHVVARDKASTVHSTEPLSITHTLNSTKPIRDLRP